MKTSAARAVPSQYSDPWPELGLPSSMETYHLLHRVTQIIGKIRLTLTPFANHWWQAALYVTPRGLTTSLITYGQSAFELRLDLLNGELTLETNAGAHETIGLQGLSVAQVYLRLMSVLKYAGINITIWPTPVEVDDRTPFNEDETRGYDADYGRRLIRTLVQVDRVLKTFRGRFRGKASPVHFFWGSFDMAVTRFSGRAAPDHPGAPNVKRSIMVEAYSQELSSCGFWPGQGLGAPAFYSYAYPEPAGYKDYPVRPVEAHYHAGLGEFILPYEAVLFSATPDETILEFLETTFQGAATLGHWEPNATKFFS